MPDFTAPEGSCRAYAKHRGCSAMSVSIAIKAQRLTASVVRDAAGKVIGISSFALADQEWERNTDPQRRINAAGGVVAPVPDALRGGRPLVSGPVALAPQTAPAELAEDVGKANTRLKTAQADLAELKYAEAAGELVLAADVEREWADLLSSVRTKLLGVPTRLKQDMPELTAAQVLKIEDVIREQLEDLVQAEIAAAP